MTDIALTLAQDRLLRPGGLDTAGLERTFGQLLGPGVDFGDLYFQHARRESWSVEDGIVRTAPIPSNRAWACGRFPGEDRLRLFR